MIYQYKVNANKHVGIRLDKYISLNLSHLSRSKIKFLINEGYKVVLFEQGEQLFSNLKRRNIDSAMMRFPAESHELSRSGQPVHRRQRFEAIINWHKKHLL